jgi:hypothetical protein
MADCEIDGVKVHCGEGHGCAVICTTDRKTCWAACSSNVTYFVQKAFLDLSPNEKLFFQCNNIRMGSLYVALQVICSDLEEPFESVDERITRHLFSGTLEEIIYHIGMRKKQYGITK